MYKIEFWINGSEIAFTKYLPYRKRIDIPLRSLPSGAEATKNESIVQIRFEKWKRHVRILALENLPQL